jgi:hypothetical protein
MNWLKGLAKQVGKLSKEISERLPKRNKRPVIRIAGRPVGYRGKLRPIPVPARGGLKRDQVAKVSSWFVLAALLLTACAPATAEPALPETGLEIGGYREVIASLQGLEAEVEEIGQVDEPLFEVDTRLIRVNGQDVQIFEFPDEATRQAAAETVSPTAATIGTVIPEWVDIPHFWSQGQVIVLYVGQDQPTIDLLTSVLGQPVAVGEAIFGPLQPTVQPEAIAAAVRDLAASLGVEIDQAQIVRFEQTEWPDACLGLPQPDEVCAQAVTPGFLVVVEVNGQQFEVRTDETGTNVRINQE